MVGTITGEGSTTDVQIGCSGTATREVAVSIREIFMHIERKVTIFDVDSSSCCIRAEGRWVCMRVGRNIKRTVLNGSSTIRLRVNAACSGSHCHNSK